MSQIKSQHRQSVLSRDQFSNYLKQHDETTFSANCFIEVQIVNMIKESKFKDDRAFSLLHQELPQILVLCFPWYLLSKS